MHAPTVNKHVEKLKLFSPEYRTDPWNTYRRLRERGPVIRIKMPLMGKCWAATTYDSVNEVLKDTEHFVRDAKNAGRKTMIPMQWVLPRVLLLVSKSMLTADDQEHRRLRLLVDQAFALRNIEGMAERVETLAQEQLDEVGRIAAGAGQVDLVEHFARPFPLTVICELLGLPAEDQPKFKKWFAPFSNVSSVLGILSVSRGLRQAVKYLRGQFDEVRREPREGLITELVRAEHEGHQLSERELLSMVFLLLVAGHETTVHLISNGVLTLLQFPDAKAALMADWSRSDDVIEELLRYCSPLQMAKPRFVANDITFYSQPLRRGEMVLPLLAAANYDPDRFENPHEFDIDRERNYHMSFGSGPHVCLGMKLARQETESALRCLFERWPNVAPAFDFARPDWSKRMGTRGLKTLYVTVN